MSCLFQKVEHVEWEVNVASFTKSPGTLWVPRNLFSRSLRDRRGQQRIGPCLSVGRYTAFWGVSPEVRSLRHLDNTEDVDILF
jgi:hypothetical protein